jgi:hypothetical protein
VQSVEQRVKTVQWKDFCQSVLDRFGKDQYDLFIRQLFQIRQSGFVNCNCQLVSIDSYILQVPIEKLIHGKLQSGYIYQLTVTCCSSTEFVFCVL